MRGKEKGRAENGRSKREGGREETGIRGSLRSKRVSDGVGVGGMEEGTDEGEDGEAASLSGPICKSVPGCWILINVLVTGKRAGDAII